MEKTCRKQLIFGKIIKGFNKKVKIEDLSKKYKVRRLSANDIEEVYHLCSKKTVYYEYCKMQGYERIELAWVKGNPQSEAFWKKNGFVPIGERSSNAAEHVIAAELRL